MLIKNVYRKPIRFMFAEKPITIASNEILEVSEGIGREMLKNPWITEYLERKCSGCSGTRIQKDSSPELSETPKIEENLETEEFDNENKKEVDSKKVDN